MSDHAAAAIGLPDTHRAKHLDRFWVLSEDLLVIATLQGHWIDASPALPRILGWTLEEVQALGGRSITHPADLDASAAQVRKLAGGQPVFRFENRVRHKNGTYRCLSWAAVASDGLFYCIGRDITDEKTANARLGLRNQALEAIGQGVVITDPNQPDNPMIYVNPAFQQLTGYTEQQLLGQNCPLLQGPGTDEAALVRLREALANGAKFSSTLLNYRQDGTSFLNQLHISPVRDAGGRLTHFVGVLSDVTEQMRVQDELRRSEGQYRILAENTDDMIILTGLDGIRRYVSPASHDILGRAPEDLIGTKLGTSIHPDDRAAALADYGELLAGRQRASTASYRVRHQSGYWRHVEARRRLLLDTRGEPQALVSVIRDITQREQLEERLRQSQKMEAVGQLTGGVAHDFNNLLTVILGNAEVLVDDPSNPALTRNLAQIILDAAVKGSELTQHLLAFGRRQSLKPVRLSLDHVVKGMIPLLRRTLGEHIELETHFSHSLFAALTDRTLLENAILNLAVNAKDAMLQCGTLAITTGEGIAGPEQGVLPVGQDIVFVTVSDTGTGMSPEVLARVFEPFFTTKEVGRGSGLGLSMVYGFAQQSGGHVAIKSLEGEGTTVTIMLPAIARAPVDHGAEGERPAPLAGRERVLLVEDDPQVLQFVSSQLVSLGYEVTAVSAGPDALELLRDGAPIDLLFTDVVLPKGMSGVELARRAKDIRPSLKVLMTSGYPEEAFQHHGRPEEGTLLLHKPFRRKQLAETLKRVLENA